MSTFPTPRGMARAIRRGNTAPSLGFERIVFDRADCVDDLCGYEFGDSELAEMARQDREREDMQRYRDLRDEGYSYHQAMLMSGRGDPDSLGCT